MKPETRASGTTAIDHRNLQEFFRDSVHEALARQRVGVDDHTEHYVVNVLTMFARSEGGRARALASVFAELAVKFQRLVDALNDVSEMSWRSSDRDVLRLYEVWLKTGSPRAHGLLRELGVSPAVVPVSRVPN
jgi:hypothetical protein